MDGEIENGVPNGQGTFHLPSGATFVGTYKEGKRHEGTFTFPDGKNISESGKIIKDGM